MLKQQTMFPKVPRWIRLTHVCWKKHLSAEWPRKSVMQPMSVGIHRDGESISACRSRTIQASYLSLAGKRFLVATWVLQNALLTVLLWQTYGLTMTKLPSMKFLRDVTFWFGCLAFFVNKMNMNNLKGHSNLPSCEVANKQLLTLQGKT